jgi:hypothetical protein
MSYTPGTMSLMRGCIDVANNPQSTVTIGRFKRRVTDKMKHIHDFDLLTGQISTYKSKNGCNRRINSPTTRNTGKKLRHKIIPFYFTDTAGELVYRKPPQHGIIAALDAHARTMFYEALETYREYKNCFMTESRANMHHVDSNPYNNSLHNLLALTPREHAAIHMLRKSVDEATNGRLRAFMGDYLNYVFPARINGAAYGDFMSARLSAADLEADCTEILVGTRSRNLEIVYIGAEGEISIQNILVALLRAEAVDIIGDARCLQAS